MTTIAITTTRPADEYTRPYRIVIRQDKYNNSHPFMVHMETNPGTPQAAHHNGDYCETLKDAAASFRRRAENAGLEVLLPGWDMVTV